MFVFTRESRFYLLKNYTGIATCYSFSFHRTNFGLWLLEWDGVETVIPVCAGWARSSAVRPGVLTLTPLTFGLGQFFMVGAVLCTVECWTASLASTYQMPIAPSPPLVTSKHVSRYYHMTPERPNCPHLRTTSLDYISQERIMGNIGKISKDS